MSKLPIKSWEEYDTFTKWRHFYSFRRGEIKKIKRRYNKRFRRFNNKLIKDELNQIDQDY